MFPVLWQLSPALVVIPSVHFYSIFFPGGRLSRISLISDFDFCWPSKNTCWLAMSPMAFAAVEPTMSPSSERISSLRSCKRIHEIVSPKRCGSSPWAPTSSCWQSLDWDHASPPSSRPRCCCRQLLHPQKSCCLEVEAAEDAAAVGVVAAAEVVPLQSEWVVVVLLVAGLEAELPSSGKICCLCFMF